MDWKQVDVFLTLALRCISYSSYRNSLVTIHVFATEAGEHICMVEIQPSLIPDYINISRDGSYPPIIMELRMEGTKELPLKRFSNLWSYSH